MKGYIHDSFTEMMQRVLDQVLSTVTDLQMVDSLEESEVVFVQGRKALETIHSWDRHFLLLPTSMDRVPVQVPDNVEVLTTPFQLVNVLEALSRVRQQLGGDQKQASEVPADAMRVLVVDDSQKHCRAAYMQLNDTCNLTVVTNYSQALAAIASGEPYKAVLTDLLLPASEETLSPDAISRYAGEEMPLGFVVALLAAKSGADVVGVVTDTGHHDHPMSAAIDRLGSVFSVEGSKMMFFNTAVTSDGKDWKQVLDTLLSNQGPMWP